ncbi:MAG: hypothetical protein ACE5G1_08685, partial [bacterium]
QHLDKIAAEVDSTYDHWQAYLSETETTSNSNGRGSNNDVATSLKARLRQAQQRANSDFERLAIEIRATNDQIQRDVRNVKNRSVVFKIAPDWIGKMLYGDLAIQAITEILRYVDLVRKNMPVANLRFQNVKLENPPRGAGQNIYFPISDSDPKFLIKNLILRSPENQKEAKDKLRVRGEITGFTSHPEVYREMQQIEVSSRYPDPRKYGIVASIDHSKDEPWEQFQLLGTGLKLFSFDLPDYPYLPNHIITDHGKLSGGVEITGDRIDCRIGVTAIPAIFRFEKTAPADSAIVNKIRSEIESQKRYFVGVRLQGTFDELSMKVYSSIDIHLAPEVEKILGRKAKWEPREVSATVDSILTAKKNEVTQLFDKRKTAIRHQISQYEKLLQ